MQVVDETGNPMRVLCVDDPDARFPIVGIWSHEGTAAVVSTTADQLCFVVEPKTKTLYGFWNDTRKESRTYESEIQRNKEFDFYNDKNMRIKFQTEIEL